MPDARRRLLVATGSQHKLDELRTLLALPNTDLVSLVDVGITDDVDETGATPPLLGVPYGSDMRLFTARGIPCVMFGTPGLELAHAVDEQVDIAALTELARVLVRLLLAGP